MKPPRQPLFLARENYRTRRAADLSRALPLLGLFLFMMPLLGLSGSEHRTGTYLIFLFGVWFGLIVIAAVLSRRLVRPRSDRDPDDAAEGPP